MCFGYFMSPENVKYWSRISEDIIEMTSMPEPIKIKKKKQAENPCRIANHKSRQVVSAQYQHQ